MPTPATLSTWSVWLLAFPKIKVRVEAQYARDAWEKARPDLLDKATEAKLVACVAFCECGFRNESESTPKQPKPRRRRAIEDAPEILRVVGPERQRFLSGSGRA